VPYIRHRPEIGTGRREATPEGEALVWRVQCACAATGQTPHYRYAAAMAAVQEHQMATAPPPEKACREPRRHRSGPYDWCPLCSDQQMLPGMEDGALAPARPDVVDAGAMDNEERVRA